MSKFRIIQVAASIIGSIGILYATWSFGCFGLSGAVEDAGTQKRIKEITGHPWWRASISAEDVKKMAAEIVSMNQQDVLYIDDQGRMMRDSSPATQLLIDRPQYYGLEFVRKMHRKGIGDRKLLIYLDPIAYRKRLDQEQALIAIKSSLDDADFKDGR